ncbi:MAG: hypothetical protein ACXQTI_08165 [Candidatus Nezhaarchaeales archaeon]
MIFNLIVPLAVIFAILRAYAQWFLAAMGFPGLEDYLGIIGFILGLVGGIMASRAGAPVTAAPTYAPPPPPPPR